MTYSTIIRPKIEKEVSFLDDSMLSRYNGSLSLYTNQKARKTLGKLNRNNGFLIGSTPFIDLQMANLNPEKPGEFPNKTRPVTREALELALIDPDFYKEFNDIYIGIGLILNPYGGRINENDLLADTLINQLTQNGINIETSKLIPYSVLALREDSGSAFGLSFDIRRKVRNLKDLVLNIDISEWDRLSDKMLSRAIFRETKWVSLSELGESYTEGRLVGISIEDAPKDSSSRYPTEHSAESSDPSSTLIPGSHKLR